MRGNNNFNVTVDLEFPFVLDDIARSLLDREYTLEEIKTVVFQMKHNKAPGPDGFPAEFYQHFWDVIGDFCLNCKMISIMVN